MKILFAVLLLLFTGPALAQDAPPFQELTGIPVMDGLTEDTDARLVFDKPEGRIIEARFAGQVSPEDVMVFYKETLFQLGWVLNDVGTGALEADFSREEEDLTITLTSTEPLEMTLEIGPSAGDEGE